MPRCLGRADILWHLDIEERSREIACDELLDLGGQPAAALHPDQERTEMGRLILSRGDGHQIPQRRDG